MSPSQQLVTTAHTACHRTEASRESEERPRKTEAGVVDTGMPRVRRDQRVKALYRAETRALSLSLSASWALCGVRVSKRYCNA